MFQKSDPAFLPILALFREMLGSTVSADRRHALRTPHRARQRAAHLLAVLGEAVHKVPPEAPCSHSNETHLPLMVPRLEKSFEASPNAKHRVPGGTAVQTSGQVHHVTSRSPPNCGRKREPDKIWCWKCCRTLGQSGQPLCRSQSQTQTPVLTKHRRPKLFAQSGRKSRLWEARQLLCEIAAGNLVFAFGSPEGLHGVLSLSSLPSRATASAATDMSKGSTETVWLMELLLYLYDIYIYYVAWVYMACLPLLSIFESALRTMVTPSSTTLLLCPILIHTTKEQSCVLKHDNRGPSTPNAQLHANPANHGYDIRGTVGKQKRLMHEL